MTAASVCRSLAWADLEGACAFLLFAFYFESLVTLREEGPVDADKYEAALSQLLPPILKSLEAVERFEPLSLITSLDSFARATLRVQFN